MIRTTLRYYLCYHIIHSSIRGCEIVFVSIYILFFLCVMFDIQTAIPFSLLKRHPKNS